MSDAPIHCDPATNPVADEEIAGLAAIREKLLVDAATVAKLLSISTGTIYALSRTQRFPKPIRLGRAARWNLNELRAWVNCGCPARFRWEIMRSEFGFAPAPDSKANGGRKRVRRFSKTHPAIEPAPAVPAENFPQSKT